MANKRKRRRQRQRAAAKKEPMVTQHKQVWREYTVAYRVESRGGPVHVIKIKEFDEDQLIPFILRIAEVKSTDDFQVLDVHRDNHDGTIEVIWEIADWPKGVGTARSKGEFMRGVKDDPLFLNSSTPAGTKPLTATTPPATVTVPPALVVKKIPVRWYTIGKAKTT